MCQQFQLLLQNGKGIKVVNILGSIVNIGSIVGEKGNFGQTVYSASKAGLIGFTKSASKEFGKSGVRVNLVQPGFTETDMTKGIL